MSTALLLRALYKFCNDLFMIIRSAMRVSVRVYGMLFRGGNRPLGNRNCTCLGPLQCYANLVTNYDKNAVWNKQNALNDKNWVILGVKSCEVHH